LSLAKNAGVSSIIKIILKIASRILLTDKLAKEEVQVSHGKKLHKLI